MSDEESGPRTRTRRSAAVKAATEIKSPPKRSTRGKKTQEVTSEPETAQVSDSEPPTNEETLQVLQEIQDLAVPEQREDEEMPPPPKQDENSSTAFPLEDSMADSTLNESSKEEESVKEGSESCDFDANLAAEENANSLPSAADAQEVPEGIPEPEVPTPPTDSSDNAIAEDIQNGDSDATKADPDAEMVSEDELPAPEKVVVQDAVEVSDDELPPPKVAELPADAENVSDDELPVGKSQDVDGKRKHDDDLDITVPPEKKQKAEDDEKKKLPDLDKYWKAVRDDSADFTAWTYLLQYVDHENDVEAAREAYDAFLSHYPYCYGYWRKYADYEKRKGNKKKCEEVFERGLKSIPLSVDLWIHYLSYCKETRVKDSEFIRSQFERALSACGLEFRSDKLWEAYIRWETEGKNMKRVSAIYDRLLNTPTQGYNTHFDNFQDLVNTNSPVNLVSVEEFKKLREEVRAKDNKKEADNDDVPPGEDEPDDHTRNDEELQAIKSRLISTRKKIHKANVTQVSNRWTYEEGIKRPYFHVKPLERIQLKNWKDYLEYEIGQGKQDRTLVLFERCLIACALYDEFWLKLIRYLETQTDENAVVRTRDAYERACTIHHANKPTLHLMWAGFEELQGNSDKAAQILANLDKQVPNVLQVAYKRINIERRRGNLDKCIELYECYINSAKNKTLAANLAIKYARFLNKVKRDIDGAVKLLQATIEKDPNNTRVALQLIDLLLQRVDVNPDEVIQVMDTFMARDNIEPDQKVLFAQRKVEFLEDFGRDCKGLQSAQRELQQAINKANEAKKKQEEANAASIPATNSSSSKSFKSKDVNPPLPSSNAYGSGAGAYNYGAAATAAQQASYYGGGYDYNYGSQWGQYPQSGYGNYGYGYGSYGSGY